MTKTSTNVQQYIITSPGTIRNDDTVSKSSPMHVLHSHYQTENPSSTLKRIKQILATMLSCVIEVDMRFSGRVTVCLILNN
jgi:hypothetical protein